MSTYEWSVIVDRKDYYGRNTIAETPMTVIADTRSEVTEKVRAAFEATYDDFRKFWSHTWRLVNVREVLAADSPAAAS